MFFVLIICSCASTPKENALDIGDVKSGVSQEGAYEATSKVAYFQPGPNHMSSTDPMPSIASMLWETYDYPIILLSFCGLAAVATGFALRARRAEAMQ